MPEEQSRQFFSTQYQITKHFHGCNLAEINIIFILFTQDYKIKIRMNIQGLEIIQVFGSFKFFRKDGNIKNRFTTFLQYLLESESDITQSSYFSEFYCLLSRSIDYNAIVQLFEDMWNAQLIRNSRQQYLLKHWLYYQALQIRPNLVKEELMLQIKKNIESKEQAGYIIGNIAKMLKFKQKEKVDFQSNIENSPIYYQFSNFLINQIELSPQQVQQKHEELIYIIQKMLNFGELSIQYQLQRHILVSFQKAYGKSSNEGVSSSKKPMQIKALFALMRQQNRLNSKIKDKIKEYKHANNQKYKRNVLESIKLELTAIDVFFLDYLTSQSRKNLQQNNSKQPKNTVLFIGPSGSGKTTIILRLLGYKLTQTVVQQVPILQPQNLKPQHKLLQTSSKGPTTKCIFSTKMPKSSFGTQENMQLCDTPGFERSMRCEVDISNSINIQSLLKSCASVKLVIVISRKKVGDKMEGIRQIAEIVSNFVVKYSKIEKEVSIVLNQFDSQTEYSKIKPGLENVLNNLTPVQQSKTEYVYFLNSLAKLFKYKKKVAAIRFHPKDTDIQDFIQEMRQGKIINPCEVFKYQISKKSNQCIVNRTATLVGFIKKYVGKDNRLALYYLNQLILLSKCLNYRPQIEQEISYLKIFIQRQAHERFKMLQKIIEGQMLQNSLNTNIFKELNRIKEQARTFEVFKDCIGKLVPIQRFQSQITEAKSRMLESITKLSFQQAAIQESKQKIFNIMRQLHTLVINKLEELYNQKKGELVNIIKGSSWELIKEKTNVLKNIMELIQKGVEIVSVDANNFERIKVVINKDDLQILITKQFQQIVKQSIKYIQTFRQNQSFKARLYKINKIIENINIFQDEAPILNQIFPNNFKNLIISSLKNLAKQLIEQSNNLFDLCDNSQIQDGQFQKILCNKDIIQRLKQIQGVCVMSQINKFYKDIIQISMEKLKSFFDNKLLQQKSIEKNEVKIIKQMIKNMVRLSEGNSCLFDQINHFKRVVKKSVIKYQTNLKGNIEKLAITLKLKRTLKQDQFIKASQLFKQIELFSKSKIFNQPQYLQNSNEQKKIDQEDSENQQENMNLSTIIQQTYNLALNKIVLPFNQIYELSKSIKNKSVYNMSLYDLSLLADFLKYKAYFKENSITQNKDISKIINNRIEDQEKNYLFNIRAIIRDIKSYFDQIYEDLIKKDGLSFQQQNNQQNKIRNFKKLSNTILKIKQYQLLQQLFLQQGFWCQEYFSKIVQVLNKFEQLISTQVSRKKKDNLDLLNTFLDIRQVTQQLKCYDEVNFEDYRTNSYEFAKIQDEISSQIKKVYATLQKIISNLFDNHQIVLSKVRKLYRHLQQNEFGNEENLSLICSHLQKYGEKLAKYLTSAKQQYNNDRTMILENLNASIYINRLYKIFHFYEELQQFVGQIFLEGFVMNEEYFEAQIADLQIEQRLQFTYKKVKDKLLSFGYRTKPRQFERTVGLMRKAQYVVQKITKDAIYSQLYTATQNQQACEANIQGKKFSARLQSFMAQQLKKPIPHQNSKQQEQSLEIDIVGRLLSNRSDETNLQRILNQKLADYFEKPGEEKKEIEQSMREILNKLPSKNRKIFEEKLEQIKQREKEQLEMRKIMDSLDQQSYNEQNGLKKN